MVARLLLLERADDARRREGKKVLRRHSRLDIRSDADARRRHLLGRQNGRRVCRRSFSADQPAIRRRSGKLDGLSRRRRRRCAGQEGAGGRSHADAADLRRSQCRPDRHSQGARRRRRRLDDAARELKVCGDKTMQHAIVSQDKWLAARKALLEKEKEFTKARDRLSEARRGQHWVKVGKDYVFDCPTGRYSLSHLFAGKSQLIVYHFMLGPGWVQGCPS